MALPQTRRSSGNFTGANEGGFSSGLWAKFEKLAPFALYNRFVVALTAATLEPTYLQDYIDQDVYFLKKYIKACELAEGCEDDKDEYSFKNVKEAAVKYCEKLEEKRDKKHAEENPNKVTVEYSNFLLATADGKIPAYTIATLIPCSKLYHVMGKKIAEAMKSDNPYKDSIELIFPTKDEGSPLPIEKFLDKLSKPLTGEEREQAERIYHHALKLDIDFFFALSFGQRTLVPLLKGDYGANRYTIVIDCNSSSEMGYELSRQYSEGYEEWLRKILPSKNGDASFDYQGLCNFLKEPSGIEIEENSNSEINHSKVDMHINQYSKELKQILKEINHPKVDMHIISVPRSADRLKAAFSQDRLHIHSDDMVTIFNKIWSSTKEYDTSIYIGRDLLCLLKADIGIVIGASSKLETAGQHFGVRFVPLFVGLVTQEGLQRSEKWIKDSGVIYTVSSWSEIYAFLLGPPVSSWPEIHAFLLGPPK